MPTGKPHTHTWWGFGDAGAGRQRHVQPAVGQLEDLHQSALDGSRYLDQATASVDPLFILFACPSSHVVLSLAVGRLVVREGSRE